MIALCAGLAVALAACGGDNVADNTAQPSTAPTTTAAQDSPAMQPSSITFAAQDSDGATISIASVELPAPGFVAVHADGGGSPGAVIGSSDLLAAGESTDVVVPLDTPLDGDTTVYPMIHIDTNDNGLYEFGEVQGVDGPGLTTDGEVAVTSAAVTVAGGSASGGTSADDTGPTAGDDTITIADFAFSGVTEVAVGTTIVVTNTDSAVHTFTAEDGTFDSGSLRKGDTFEFTFDTPGEFAYFCNFHPSMTGTITVTG